MRSCGLAVASGLSTTVLSSKSFLRSSTKVSIDSQNNRIADSFGVRLLEVPKSYTSHTFRRRLLFPPFVSMADNITLGSGIAAHPLDLVQSPRPNWPGDVTLPRVYPVYSSSALGYQYTAPAVYENHWQWTTAPPWIPAINQHGNATDEEADVEDEGDSDSSGPVQKNAIRQTIIKMPPAHRDHCIHPCKMSTNCVIHYCGQCKKPRSRGYHRNHPVLPGQAIEQGICGKCKSKPRKNGGYDGTRETVRIHVRDDDRQSRGRSPPDSYRVMRYRRVSSEVERDRSNSASRTRVVICDGSSGSSSRRLSLPGAFGEARETFSHRTTMRDSGPSLSGKADRLSIQFSDDETPKTLRGGRRTAAPGEGDLGSSDDRKPQRRRISWGDAEARLASHPMPFRHGRPVNFEDHHQGSLSPSSSGRQSQRPSSPLTRPPMPSAAQKLPSSLSRGRADVVPLNPGKADKGSLSYVNRPQRPSASQDQDHRQRPGPAHNEQDQRPKPASRQRAKQSEPVAQINIRHSRSRARSSSPAEVEVIRLRSILRSPSRPRFEASVRNVKSRTDNNSGGSNTANYGGPRVQFSGESAATRRTSGITEASAAAFKHRRVPRHGADAHYSSRGDPTRDSELDGE